MHDELLLPFGLHRIGLWLKRAFKLFVILLIIFGTYRAFRYVNPAAPDVYRIGVDTSWYPLALFGKEHNMTAFTSDILYSIARNQSIKVEMVRAGPKRLMELLEDELVDGIMTSLLPEGGLTDKYYFSDPYYRYGAVLVVRKDEDVHSLVELSKKSIAVRSNSPILYRLPLDPETSVVPYDNYFTMLQALADRKVDGVVMDQLLYYLYFGSLYRDLFKVVTRPMTSEGLRLMALKENYTEELIEMFNTGLKNIKEEGTYNKLLAEWDLYDPEQVQE